MKKSVLFLAFLLIGFATKAQYYGDDSYGNDRYNNRYYYEDNFDWRWDIRVRITEGIQKGLITSREADRLYDRLERLERLEYTYQADGNFDAWEQDEVWNEVVWLNRQVGIELYDADRTFYGYSRQGLAYRGYFHWYYPGGYNFYRYDQRGFGSRHRGYASRNYYPQHNNNGYYGDRHVYRNDNRRYDKPRNNDYNRYDNKGGGDYRRDEKRNDRDTRYERPSTHQSSPRNNENNGGYNRPQERGSYEKGRNNDNIDRSLKIERPQQNEAPRNSGGNERPSRGSSENSGGFSPRANGRGQDNVNRMDNRQTESRTKHGRGNEF